MNFTEHLEIAGNAQPAETLFYKSVVGQASGTVDLLMHVFKPEGHLPSDRKASIVFFFGGGWKDGSPSQFYPQCSYLAARGMVAMSAEYRVSSRHGTSPRECVQDGRSAVRWIRHHATELGLDPGRIAAGGGSAGGHVAAATGSVSGLDEPGESTSTSACPDALVLFNPVLDNGPDGYGYETVKTYWSLISPFHNISARTPPTVIFLGRNDHLIPVSTVEKYKNSMQQAGRRCDIHLYEGQGHGFFNFTRSRDHYRLTVEAMDEFLVSLGFLKSIS